MNIARAYSHKYVAATSVLYQLLEPVMGGDLLRQIDDLHGYLESPWMSPDKSERNSERNSGRKSERNSGVGSALESASAFKEAFFASIALQAVRAFAFVHKKGIVHVDIKPENILVSKKFKRCTRNPWACRLKVIDFGLALS